MNLKVCLVPMEIRWGEKSRNLLKVEDLLKNVESDTKLVVLPETFSTGFPSPDNISLIKELAEPDDGQTIKALRKLSEGYGYAITGSFLAYDSGCFYNRIFFIYPDGDVKFANKRHLFAYGGENKIFKPGNSRLTVNYLGWNICLIVCYDLRFPVWCRNVNNDYDIMVAVANWPVSRINVWETLLKARAMENSAYVCGVDCKGIDTRGSEYNGSSHLFDYKGNDLALAINDSPLLYASLNYEKLLDYREKFPVWKDNDYFELKI
ncbi:MAG: nitrilase family protein [Muribaculaceae bacterium]|nr:nitrilase family protein [Muribaculaceae bacterium]